MAMISNSRQTKETQVQVALYSPVGKIETGIGFFSHLLDVFSFHGSFSLSLKASGDLHVDTHHLVEDCGLVLGGAFRKMGTEGIRRFSSLIHPMDETLIQVVVDISGRPYLNYGITLKRERVGDLEVETIFEFWRAFVNQARITLHLIQLKGENDHHILEALFKGTGRALKEAFLREDQEIKSTKGIID